MKVISVFFRSFAFALLLCTILSEAARADDDSAEAFMSVTFGLSAARTQKRMEKSGAVAADFIRDGRLSMQGTFEYRSAVFLFGFHAKKGLNYKAAYIGSTGNANEDKALYDALREAYNIRFSPTNERAAQDLRTKGRITLRNSWKPNKDTVISLSYNPQVTKRFPGDSPGDRPIHLIYIYSKWTNK